MADVDIAPGPFPAEAVAFWRAKDLKPSFSYLDVWGEEHTHAFAAAKVMRHDVLAVLRQSLNDALVKGLPFDAWRAQVGPKLESVGWWHPHEVVDPLTGKISKVDPPRRLQTIFDTNMRVARAVGQWDRIQRNKRYRPYMLYLHGNSERPRPMHVSWHGLLLPVDDDFWQAHFPPCGWHCSCSVRSVSEREARTLEAEGILAHDAGPVLDDDGNPTGHVKDTRIAVRRTAPKEVLVPFLNKRTGVVELVPKGVDPGFQFPPAVGRTKALERDAAE